MKMTELIFILSIFLCPSCWAEKEFHPFFFYDYDPGSVFFEIAPAEIVNFNRNNPYEYQIYGYVKDVAGYGCEYFAVSTFVEEEDGRLFSICNDHVSVISGARSIYDLTDEDAFDMKRISAKGLELFLDDVVSRSVKTLGGKKQLEDKLRERKFKNILPSNLLEALGRVGINFTNQ